VPITAAIFDMATIYNFCGTVWPHFKLLTIILAWG